ncbi:hypothetical protein GGS26DRAFT_281318 [Hypomontagnella submonticulosa]|nr:hypothetical protein GGS26DRAFT_281318 [Hypomontagnella submonticulosa]
MATPTPTKTMSSRLLTMKFMQRAAATPSSNPSSPATPNSDKQASKRRKVAHKPAKRDDADSLAQIDQAVVQAAIAEEERKRQEALLQHAAELGDARWVLDIPDEFTGSGHTIQTPLNVVRVGFAQIDSQFDPSDPASLDNLESTDTKTSAVRRYNMDNKKATKPAKSDSDDSSSESDSDYDTSSQDNGPGRNSYGQRADSIRAAFQSKKSAEQAKAKQFAEKRRKKEVKLNGTKRSSTSGGLASISSGGGIPNRPPMKMVCHRCNKPGHKAAECKNPSKRAAP